jgi:dTDP-4-dehydrorhamnose reductase
MARILVTGATGFVGSTVMRLLQICGHDVHGLLRRPSERPLPWPSQVVDMASQKELTSALDGADAVVHLAIANDFNRLAQDRAYAYDSYVGLTQRVVRAALDNGAQPVYLSSDWVLDGRRHMVDEDEPPNPLNFYGVLKALGEQVIRDLAPYGAIVRVGGVMGRHLLAESPRSQDVGFGYFVLSLVEALRSGTRFDIFEGDGVNLTATPVTSSEIGAGIERIISRGAHGTFHVVASNAVTRFELADQTCEIFELDSRLVGRCVPPPESRFPEAVPVDTSMSSERTREVLGLAPSTVRDHLAALRTEIETGEIQPITRNN